MKKLICFVCALALALNLCACSQKPAGRYSSPEEVTVADLRDNTTPMTMLSNNGAFEIQWRNDDELNNGQYASTTIMRYRYDGDIIQINQIADYDSGDHTLLYFTSDLTMPKLFVENTEGVKVLDMGAREVQDNLDHSLLGFDDYDCEITSAKKTDSGYQIEYDALLNGEKVQHVVMDMTPETGAVTGAVLTYYSGETVEGEFKVTVTYDQDIKVDTTPRDKAIEQGLYDPEQARLDMEAAANSTPSSFVFAAKDMDGNLVSQSSLGDYELLMINFWEPWCQPCVGEMEDLEHIYEDYRDSGVVILGVLSSGDYDDDARAVIKELGITYPIVHADNYLALYETDSVPTTIFVDKAGNVLTEEPYIGARDYNDWLSIITDLLAQIEKNQETDE